MAEELGILAAIEDLEIQEVAARNVRVFQNCFETMTDVKFIKTFRLPKVLVRELINTLEPFVGQRHHGSALSLQEKVLITLNFYAVGSYQNGVGDNQYIRVSQASVSRSIDEVTNLLNNPAIFQQYIKFPRNFRDLNDLRRRFYEKYGMPGVIGCLDCTHVAIIPPKRINPEDPPEHIFVNRKRYHSINVQLVCDESMKILHVNARFPGSTHDNHIFQNSTLEQFLKNLYEQDEGYFLLADSGYPLRPWMMTPLNNPHTPEEVRYNDIQKSARSIIEQCNGLLKMRFRCLLKHRVLHYSPNKCSKVINACCVLHNICVENNIELLDDGENNEELDYGIIPDFYNQEDEANARNPWLLRGIRMQRRVIYSLRQ